MKITILGHTMQQPSIARNKIRRVLRFSIFEILVSIGILSLLISTFSYLGYDALQEFRKRSGRKAFKEYLISLHHKNALLENYLMVAIEQKGEKITTTLGGHVAGIKEKQTNKEFFVGKIFEEGSRYAINITPQAIPDNKHLAQWIEENDCSFRFRNPS
ncbi:hypothetical protein K0U07_05685 [bacterium]|nr:hypothetical protein [bacterium]